MLNWLDVKKKNKIFIGIPLTLVTVANVAKFVSEIIFIIHYEIWKLWIRIKNYNREGGNEEEVQLFGENEDEQVLLNLQVCY